MNALPEPGRKHYRARQRGQAMILIAVMLVLGVMTAVYATVSSTSVSIANRQAVNTGKVLAEVKDALIAWSAARTPTGGSPNIRPGELPCPDNDNSGTDPGGCTAGAIGRVPWKSLGIPEPKDSAGETLWYAISGPFRNASQSPAPITSNTLGTLTVYHSSSATTLTSQAIAVIFAPGASLGAQDRSCTVGVNCTATGQCTTSPASLTPKCNPTNYLEATSGGNNAQTNGPFIQATSSSTFNDRLLAITNEDLMPLVEQRVAREIMSILESYRTATAASTLYPGGIYPWAALADGNSNDDIGTAAYNKNRMPCNNASPVAWNTAVTLSSPPSTTPSLPNWLTNGCWSTGWTSLIYYAVSKARLFNGGAGCAPSSSQCTAGTLTVTNASNAIANLCSTGTVPFTCTPTVVSSGSANLVLMTPGAYTGTPSRDWPSSFSTISGYFDDSENYNNNDDNFVVPSATSKNRDRIYIVR